jgi:hypothetical protein
MRHVQFTTRRLMIAVAVVAVLLAVGLEAARLARISAARRRYAASCAASEVLARKRALGFSQSAKAAQTELHSIRSRPDLNVGGLPPASWALLDRSFLRLSESFETLASKLESSATSYSRNAAFWASMRRKYERAARSPWFAIEPDPPPLL